MSAYMFCTSSTFEKYGPFNEDVELGEEWSILAMLYKEQRNRFIYDRSVTARTSNRRMELQPFGYTRTFIKYVWAVLFPCGRKNYSDKIRHLYAPHIKRGEI